MNEFHNPYATALDGLDLDDPVSAFFDFCREREQIRFLRESHAPDPWTEDPIFQQGRFLNVFREDDRVSKAILRFARSLEKDLSALIHALFFARWCNRQETLDKLSKKILSRPKELRKKLETLDPWCNMTAYPVEPVHWEGMQYSRFDAATILFEEIKESLTEILSGAQSDVIKATNEVNALFTVSYTHLTLPTKLEV